MPGLHPPSSYSTYRPKYDDYQEDEDYPLPPSAPYSRASSVLPPDAPSFYFANTTDSTYFVAEGDSMARHIEIQPSSEQIEELKNLYIINSHPSAEEREILAERIGM